MVTKKAGYRTLEHIWFGVCWCRRYPMDMKVRFCGATVKALQQARREALRAGDLRVIRRVSALLELPAAEVAAVAESRGVGATTVSRWLAAFLLQGLSSLRYRTAPGWPAK